MPTSDNAYEFFAFISYKRGEEDEHYAKWLQRKLEGYRIPTEIAEEKSATEEFFVPRKFKVFRDKSDLGSHADLQQGLIQSLDSSRFLIVICSPRSAGSPYVNDEVRHFQEQGRGQNVIPFIINGTPAPKPGEAQCYPPCLTAEMLGVTLAEGTKEEALIKVIARLLQVDFARLYQRHLRTQRRFFAKLAAISLSIILSLALLLAWAVDAERRATEQRKEAEGLVQFLTFDLREEAFAYIPIKAQQKILDKVSAYYSRWQADSFLSRYTLAMHALNTGVALFSEGEEVTAMQELERAALLLQTLSSEAPGNAVLLRAEATARSKLGSLHQYKNSEKTALDLYTQSLALFEACLSLEPQNTVVMQEYLQALDLVAGLLVAGDEAARAWPYVQKMQELLPKLRQSAVPASELLKHEYIIMVAQCSGAAVSAPENPSGQAQDHEQTAACIRSLEIARELYKADPRNSALASRCIGSSIALAFQHLQDLRLQEATRLAALAGGFAAELEASDKDNVSWQFFSGITEAMSARFAMLGLNPAPLELMQQLERGMGKARQATAKNPENLLIRMLFFRMEQLSDAPLALTDKNLKAAREKLYKLRDALTAAPRNSMLAKQYTEGLGKHCFQLTQARHSEEAYACTREYIGLLEHIVRQNPSNSNLSDLANAYSTQGDACLLMHKDDEAIDVFRKGINLLEKNPQSFSGDSITGINLWMLYLSLIDALTDKGENAQAYAVGKKGLTQLTGKKGFENSSLFGALPAIALHAQTASVAHSLALYTEAITLCREVYPIILKQIKSPMFLLQGEDTKVCANTLGMLAQLYIDLGEMDEALAALTKAQSALTDKKPDSEGFFLHPTEAGVHIAYASYCRHTGQSETAAAQAKIAAELALAAPSDSVVASIVIPMAMTILNDLQFYAEAENVAKPMPDRWKKSEAKFLGVDARASVAEFFIESARYCLASQRVKEAAAYLEQARRNLEDILAIYSRGSQETSQQRNIHAGVLFTASRLEQAQGDLCALEKKYQAATEAYETSLKHNRTLGELEPRQRIWKDFQRETLRKAQSAYLTLGQRAKAKECEAEAHSLNRSYINK